MKYQRGGVLPQLGQCLTHTEPAVGCQLKKAQAHNANMILIQNMGAAGGARRRRGGGGAPVCPTAPGVPTISPTYAAGANNNMSPNGNHNIYAGLKLQAVQKANAQNDSVAGWADINKTQAGGSALGNFVENLNNMAGGAGDLCTNLDTSEGRKKCQEGYETCLKGRAIQNEDIRHLKEKVEQEKGVDRGPDLMQFPPTEGVLVPGVTGGGGTRARRRKTHRRKNKKYRRRRKCGGDSGGPGTADSDGDPERATDNLPDGRSSHGSFGGGRSRRHKRSKNRRFKRRRTRRHKRRKSHRYRRKKSRHTRKRGGWLGFKNFPFKEKKKEVDKCKKYTAVLRPPSVFKKALAKVKNKMKRKRMKDCRSSLYRELKY